MISFVAGLVLANSLSIGALVALTVHEKGKINLQGVNLVVFVSSISFILLHYILPKYGVYIGDWSLWVGVGLLLISVALAFIKPEKH